MSTVPYTDDLLYGRPTTVGPDCRDGKHRACRGDAWDTRTDQPAVCGCGCHCDCDGSDDHTNTCDMHREV
jgi:hypothetical protein